MTSIYVCLVADIMSAQKLLNVEEAKKEAVFQMLVSQLGLSESFIGADDAKQILSILNHGIWKPKDEIDEAEITKTFKRIRAK